MLEADRNAANCGWNLRCTESGGWQLQEFDLTLVPDNFRHTETVRVTGDTFQQEDSPAVSENPAIPRGQVRLIFFVTHAK